MPPTEENQRHWDFEWYATLHKEKHTILEGLKEYGYAGMDEGNKTRHLLAGIKTTALDSVKRQILYNAKLRQDYAKCLVLFNNYIMQTKVNKPQELNISSTTTKTEIEQKKRKPQGRVEDKYYTIQEYKALSNEQKKELKDLRANRGHDAKRRKFNKGSVKGQLQRLNNNSQSYSPTKGPMVELLRIQAHLVPHQLQMAPPPLKTVTTIIILPSLANKPDARLKGTDTLRDHLEEELLSQTKTQPEVPVQSELPQLALSPSIMNPTVSWTVMQTHVCWGNMHTSSWTMGKQLTLLDMIRARGHLQAT